MSPEIIIRKTRQELADEVERVLSIIGYPYWDSLNMNMTGLATNATVSSVYSVSGSPFVVSGFTSVAPFDSEFIGVQLTNFQTNQIYNNNPYCLRTLLGSYGANTSPPVIRDGSRLARLHNPWYLRNGDRIQATVTDFGTTATFAFIIFNGWRFDPVLLSSLNLTAKTMPHRQPVELQNRVNPAIDYSYLPHGEVVVRLIEHLATSGLADNHWAVLRNTSAAGGSTTNTSFSPDGYHFLVTEIFSRDQRTFMTRIKLTDVARNRLLIPTSTPACGVFSAAGLAQPLPVPLLLQDGMTLALTANNTSGSTSTFELVMKGIRF